MKHPWHKSDPENDSSQPFEVLLQLLFPITLILAFVVITELGVWKRQYIALKEQMIDTPLGISNSQRQKAIITLQEQLLLEAVREEFDKKSNELQLSHYESLMPTPDQILARTVRPDFAKVTRDLYDSFGTITQRATTEEQMRDRSVNHFNDLANEMAQSDPDLGGVSLSELRRIDPANKTEA